MAKLLKNGNILSRRCGGDEDLIVCGAEEVTPDNPCYELEIMWLPKDDKKRAQKLLEEHRQKTALR